MLYEGVSVSQIGVMFGMDSRDVSMKIQGVSPSGVRAGHPIYAIKDVARKLWKPGPEEIEQLMKKMSHHDLPKIFSKEYWAGLRSRQEYELKAGDLWPTVKVIEAVGELMKLFKMNALLMQDAVERQTELTEKQREIIVNLIHGSLEDLASQVEMKFASKGNADGIQKEAIDDEL